jgi:hypothetical protein
MSIAAIFLILAFVCFCASAVGVSTRANLQSVGLAFLAAAMLVGTSVVG